LVFDKLESIFDYMNAIEYALKTGHTKIFYDLVEVAKTINNRELKNFLHELLGDNIFHQF